MRATLPCGVEFANIVVIKELLFLLNYVVGKTPAEDGPKYRWNNK